MIFFLDTKARTGQDVFSLMGLRGHYPACPMHVGAKYIPGLPVVKFVTRESGQTIPYTSRETDNQGHRWTPAFLT